MISPDFQRALLEAIDGDGEVRFMEPMARHTTLRIGGPADAWIAPSSVAGVQCVRRLCSQYGVPCVALGAGSNLLVHDGGVRGVVLASDRLRRLSFLLTDDASASLPHAPPVAMRGYTVVEVEAGVSTGKLLSEAMRRNLGGVEFLGGVPGSVGGGLVMNAGTYLGEFKDVTVQVDSVDMYGRLVQRDQRACGFVYRGSALPPDEMVVAGRLHLPPRPRAEIEAAVRGLRERRRAREPHGYPNAGSIFKNPPGDYAGRLIEACGLKGIRIGDAEVAIAHANWILNKDSARATDVLALIDLVRRAVQERFGVTLELEVKIVGEAA